MFSRIATFLRTKSTIVRGFRNTSRRLGDHHGEHHHSGPWAPKHENSNYQYGYPFGLGPGYKWEGYELPTLVLYAVMFWTLWDIDSREPEEMPLEVRRPNYLVCCHELIRQLWARNEALAREAAAERGEKIEFGKYYWRPDTFDPKHLSLQHYLENKEE